jgi:propionate CoA-transferase
MNTSAKADLLDVVRIDGEEWLHYKSFPIDVAIIRGTFADPQGNVSLIGEAANLDIHAIALAAHNGGGKVIAQVRHAVEARSLPARQVNVPGVQVDAVVVDPDQRTCYDIAVDPALSGERRGIVPAEPAQPVKARLVIARRAAVNYGYGMPDGVAKLVAMRGLGDRHTYSIEHGAYGGTLLDGPLFG